MVCLFSRPVRDEDGSWLLERFLDVPIGCWIDDGNICDNLLRGEILAFITHMKIRGYDQVHLVLTSSYPWR